MKRKFSKRIAIYLSLTVIITTFLSGCQSGASTNTNKGTAIKEGGKVVLAIPQDPDFLDPYQAVAAGTKEILFNIFEGLVKIDEKGNYYPAVASSFKSSSDSLSYTFTLRDGIKFQNGNKVTVADVKYSLEKVKTGNKGVPLLPAFKNVKSIDTPDEKTIVVNLIKPDTDFLPNLTVAIVPKDYADQNKKPIGTGPYKFVEYTPQQHLVLDKNTSYWGTGTAAPHLDEVEFKIYADYNAAFLDLQAGKVDILPRISNDKIDQLSKDFYVKKGEQNMVQLLAFNNKIKPFDDVRVRQAINYAVNVDEIIKAVAFGYGTKLGSNMSPVMTKYYQPGLDTTYKQNLEKAKSLLKEAGYPDGFKTSITVPSNYTFHVDTAQVIADQLKKIGITAEIKPVEWSVWLSKVYAGRDYESTVIGLTSDNTPLSVLGRYLSTASGNFLNYNNPKYDEALNKAISETDDKKRADDYKGLQTILTKDAAAVYIQDPNIIIAIKNNIQGYKIYPIYVQDLASLYYTK